MSRRLVVVLLALCGLWMSADGQYRWAPTALWAEPCSLRGQAHGVALPRGQGDPTLAEPQSAEWAALPAPSRNPHRLGHAVIYDPVEDMLYMAGGMESGEGPELSTFQRFNPRTNVWTDRAAMPEARAWLDGQGSCITRLARIFVFGGMTGSGTAHNNCWEYRPGTNSWTVRETMPFRTLAYASGVWRDSLIYILGGFGAGAAVQIYNPYTNTWALGTDMPEPGDMGSGTIVGDTIYITNFYNRQSNRLWSNGRKGAINPANPTQVTWSDWTTVPTLGFSGGTAKLGGRVCRLGGFASLAGEPHRRGWLYEPRTGQLDTLRWLPAPPHTGVARCNFITGGEATYQLFKIAGDDEGDWVIPNNTYYWLSLTPPYDLAVRWWSRPPARVDSGVPVTMVLELRNFGLVPDSALLGIRVDSAGTLVYSEDTVIIRPDWELVTFPPWTPHPQLWSGYKAYGFVWVRGDPVPTNDTVPATCIRTSDTMFSYYSALAPVIDGYLDTGEWDDAYSFNCSHVRWGYPPDAGLGWLKHDAEFLYLAFALPHAGTRDPADRVNIYIDENYDRSWPLPGNTNEGDYRIWVNSAGRDEVLYRWHTTDTFGQANPTPNATSASGTLNGQLVFECRLPIGTLPYCLDINPENDTVGVHLHLLDDSTFYGWWPLAMSPDSWRRPSGYGTVVFGPQTGVAWDTSRNGGHSGHVPRRFSLSVRPNVVVGGWTRLHYTLPTAAPAELFVADVTGRRLLCSNCAGSSTSLLLDLRQLASGVYYVQLKAGGAVRTAQLVLQQ